MILDLEQRDGGELLECDICVVGSGPAAICLALQFSDTATRVLILESGGLDPERATQNLYQGESIGYALANGMSGSRSRFFGGSSNCWAGACTPLDDIDFAVRDWVPNSGWPVGPQIVTPFAERAQKACLVGSYVYDERILGDDPARQLAFAPESLELRFWQFSAEARLGRYYRAAFEASANITVVLHANVTQIESNEAANHVEALTVRSLHGKSLTVRARRFVLACGGIENARLLLASDSRMPAGLGNANGLVGRYFMEHPVCVSATVVPRRADDPRLNFLNVFHEPTPQFEGTRFNALIRTSDAFQRRHQILNTALFVVDHDSEFTPGLMAAVRLRRALHERRMPDDFSRDVVRVLKDFRSVATAAYGRYMRYGATYNRLGLKLQAETVPNSDSRVTLSDRRDALGCRQARLDWRMTPLDRRTLDVITAEVAREFDRLDLADVKLDQWMLDRPGGYPDDMRGGVHHTGTTRMSAAPQDGVVNTDCRMHAVDNLYVAGSSVFPTNSWANPTWMISCLAIRLADHLKQVMAGEGRA